MTRGNSIVADAPPSILMLLAAAVVLIGWAVATEQWMALAVILGVPLLVFAPAELPLGLYAFLVPFDSIATIGANGQTTLNWFVGIAAAGVLLAKGLVSGRLQRPSKAAVYWFLFIAWCAVTAAWAMEPKMAFQRLSTASSLLLLYMIVVCYRTTERQLYCVTWLTVAGAVTASAYVALHAPNQAIAERAALGETDPNHLGASMLLPLAIAIGWFLGARSRMVRIAVAVAVLVIASGMFLSMSRGTLLAFVVMIFVFVIRLRLYRRMGILAAMLATACLPLLWMPSILFQRIQQGVSGHSAGRYDIWQVGMRMLADHGLVGVGIGNFAAAYVNYSGYAAIFRGYTRVSHNILLQVSVETGLIGLVLFMAAITLEFRAVRRFLRPAATLSYNLIALEAACWATLVVGLSLDNLWRKYFWLAWMLMAITLQAQRALRPAQQEALNSQIKA